MTDEIVEQDITAAGTVADVVKGFKDMLPEDLRDDPTISRFENVADLAKSYKEARTKIGWDPTMVVKLPGEDAKPEDYEPLYKALGRPTEYTAYEVPRIEIGEGKEFQFNEGFVESMRKAAFENGLGKRQFEKLMRATGEHHKTVQLLGQQEFENLQKEAENALKTAWGDKFEERYNLAEQAKNALKDKPNYVAMMELLARHGESLSEDTAISGSPTGGGDAPIGGAKAAIEELGKLAGDKDFLAKWMSGDKEAVEKRRRLYVAAYPERKNG